MRPGRKGAARIMVNAASIVLLILLTLNLIQTIGGRMQNPEYGELVPVWVDCFRIGKLLIPLIILRVLYRTVLKKQ